MDGNGLDDDDVDHMDFDDYHSGDADCNSDDSCGCDDNDRGEEEEEEEEEGDHREASPDEASEEILAEE